MSMRRTYRVNLSDMVSAGAGAIGVLCVAANLVSWTGWRRRERAQVGCVGWEGSARRDTWPFAMPKEKGSGGEAVLRRRAMLGRERERKQGLEGRGR